MRCSAIELLTEIRDRLRNLDKLEERRQKKSARQARYRARQKHVDATQHVDATKEDEKGKEGKSPYDPLKEEKGKEEENTPLRGRAREDERDGLFAQFWSAYPGPRKRCKPKCRDKVFTLLADPATRQATFAKLMAGLDHWKHHDTWIRDGGRFIQAPLVWLNNEDWDAEITVGPLVAPSARLDPRTAAFERQRAEAEERRRHAAEIATRLLTESGALPEIKCKKGQTSFTLNSTEGGAR